MVLTISGFSSTIINASSAQTLQQIPQPVQALASTARENNSPEPFSTNSGSLKKTSFMETGNEAI